MRRTAAGESSLELMLDVICNAFGGILLIAMLLAVMTQNTISTKMKDAETKLAAMQAAGERDKLRAEIDSLKSQLEVLGKAATALPDEVRNAWEDYRLLRQKEEELRSATQALTDLRKQLQDEIREVQQAVATLESQTQEKEQELRAKEGELASARRRSTFVVRLPKEDDTPSNTRDIVLILRYDKMYIWHLYDRNGNRYALNTDEMFVIGESQDGIDVAPRPEKGIAISLDNKDMIVNRLKQCSDAKYLDIGLWEDTFDKWPIFREIVVKAGYRYRLLLLKEGGKLMDRGGTDARYQ